MLRVEINQGTRNRTCIGRMWNYRSPDKGRCLQPYVLKISTQVTSRAGERLRLEGHLGGPSVSELHRCCGGVLASGRNLSIDLEGVSFIDREGVALLRTLKLSGVELINCSPFVGLRIAEDRMK